MYCIKLPDISVSFCVFFGRKIARQLGSATLGEFKILEIMAHQTILRLFLKKSGESDSQKSQSWSGTDYPGPKASDSDFPKKNQRFMQFLR